MKTLSLSALFFLLLPITAFTQEPDKTVDTFNLPKRVDTFNVAKTIDTFNLAKERERPGKKGKNIALKAFAPVEDRNPFIIYTGKIIRNIRTRALGFESKINDSATYSGFGVAIANSLHKNTREKVIYNNLLFSEGDHLNPYLLADNERHLRDLNYVQDAVIVVQKIPDVTDSVDLLVLLKDGFSIVPGVGAGGLKKYDMSLTEENLAGTGSRISFGGFYDNARKPKFGYGADFLQRNIKGSFINWGLGFRDYTQAFNSNTRNDENTYYIRIEKPLASQYLRWMGALDLSYNHTKNGYLEDTVYRRDFRYSYYNIDGWFAYNFGTGKMKYKSLKSTVRKFIGLRMFHQQFTTIPEKNEASYDGTYSNVTGVLASFSLFKQNYFRTSYIYGFGRNEDVPQGFTASLIGGYTLRKDSLYDKPRVRPYFGLEGIYGKYNKKGSYSSYTFRLGGYHYQNDWEDFDLLLNADHFTSLRKINNRWYKRFFLSGGITKQFTPVLEQALIIRSPFGLPYFEYGYVDADLRTTVKTEAVFYHTKKFVGFGFAPFAFADMILLKPTKESFNKSDFYSAIGTGFRIRNENIMFGTIEARFSYYPRIIPGMTHFKIRFDTNLRYKYNSSFIRRPDFVAPNF